MNQTVSKSDMNMAIIGRANPNTLFEMSAPPARAIAAIGVKFGQCGIRRKIAATMIALKTRINFG